MSRPAKMSRQLLKSLFMKPATINYPAEASGMPEGFRGKLKFNAKNCIGCKLCMRDCPSGAIEIIKTGEKEFQAHINLGKCIYCGQCVDSCLKKALEITAEFELASLDPEKLKVIFHAENKSSPGQ
ncbi:MAG: 4Fe-4S dicluster domain-containing protein [Candidatus Omnitrophica bacterium]|nr:4Fe-4S dicluster domain-containing protein [Candidatus Omnitrophota bacterium]